MRQLITIPKNLHNKLKDLGAAAIYLFGSYAEKVPGPDSDIDIGILMREPKLVDFSSSTLNLYQEFYDLLEPVLSKHTANLDIIFLQRADLGLRANAVRFGKLIFESDQKTRLDFEEITLILFSDFAYLQQGIDQAILGRI